MERETDIENYLVSQVRAIGGEVRKVRWVSRAHAPDRRVMAPRRCAWVELKAPGKPLRAGQAREHARMARYGEDVVTIDSKDGVDAFVATL